MKTKQTPSDVALQKIFAVAGLSLVAAGSVASLYYTYVNRRFISDPLFIVYYLNYFVLLAGGFLLGYFIRKKTLSATPFQRVFAGSVYAVLAITIHSVIELVRFALYHVVGTPPFPWGKIMFLGGPIVALIITFAIVFALQYRRNQPSISRATKWVLLVSFVLTQAYPLLTNRINFQASGLGNVILSYATNPLFIALISFLVLSKIRNSVDRAFYATLTGAFYATLLVVLWNFNIDPSGEASAVFGVIALIVSIVAIGSIIFYARRVTGKMQAS